MATTRKIALEAEEWYVLCNWLRSRENRLMYAIRSRSKEWEQLFELRQSIENQRSAVDETSAVLQTVVLSDSEVARLSNFLRRRSLRLRFVPWRDRERRDVVHLRRRVYDQL